MSELSFKKQINDLEEEVKKVALEADETPSSGSYSHANILLIVGASTPFVIAIILYMIRPKFIIVKDSDKINHKKVVQISLLLSLFVWAGLYIFSQYGSKICGACSTIKS